MMRSRKARSYAPLGILVAVLAIVFGLGFHRKPRFIQNFEEEEYGQDNPFVEPDSVSDGLAVYAVGRGEPVLLFPYPHAHTTMPMAQGALAERLVELGRTVVTFDVPGAYRSTRKPLGSMEEMLRSADETLDRLGIQEPVDVIGHSMSGFSALAFAIERPERTRRLIVVGSFSGFPAVARWSMPKNTFHILQPEFWQLAIWGIRVNAGRADLALHKRLQNLMTETSYHDKTRFRPLEIDADDHDKGVPIRMVWNRNMYRRLSYADRLGAVQAPTLVLVGRHDPEAPPPCAQELVEGIPGAHMVIFEESGHYPFSEEAPAFLRVVGAFLDGADKV